MTSLPADEPPIPFVTVTNWVRAARLCRIDIEAIFRDEGIDTGNLHPETATIHRETMQRLMHRCVDDTRRAGGPLHFPLVLGESFAFEYLSDIETFITTSATLRDATRALDWIPPLINPYMRLSLSEHGPDARISITYQHADLLPDRMSPFSEAVFAAHFKFSRLLLGELAPIGHITFRHARHQDSDACDTFFQVPIRYDEPMDALWFDRALLDRPLTGAFPTLHEQAALRVVQRIAQRVEQDQQALHPPGAHPLVEQIERAFTDKPRLIGLGLDALAEELKLHARTLQRRLKEVGDSHSDIQSRVRFRLAQQWLRDPLQSIEDISDRLGFSDRRSFTQAFARWAGQTPSQYRKAHEEAIRGNS